MTATPSKPEGVLVPWLLHLWHNSIVHSCGRVWFLGCLQWFWTQSCCIFVAGRNCLTILRSSEQGGDDCWINPQVLGSNQKAAPRQIWHIYRSWPFLLWFLPDIIEKMGMIWWYVKSVFAITKWVMEIYFFPELQLIETCIFLTFCICLFLYKGIKGKLVHPLKQTTLKNINIPSWWFFKFKFFILSIFVYHTLHDSFKLSIHWWHQTFRQSWYLKISVSKLSLKVLGRLK